MSAVLKEPPRQYPMTRHRWTVDDYYRLVGAGVLSEDTRVELIEGEIVDMAPIGSLHAYALDRLVRVFYRAAANRCLIRVQNPVHLDTYNEPQPDLALVIDRDYSAAHPQAGDILLLIEVSDTTLSFDREIKLPLYARHGIPEVWLLDVSTRQLTVYRQPSDGQYRLTWQPVTGQSVEIGGLPGVALALEEMVGG